MDDASVGGLSLIQQPADEQGLSSDIVIVSVAKG